ncbi:MAG: NDP-sugar synthase [Acidobacteriota bacterium]|nr:NDP-sugar synthase [Acidobacteriota bacterium]
MKGFILAAGYGTRLRPITYTMPKPMVPLCNRPLIAWAVESFLAAGVRDLIVNLHHLPESLQRFLREQYAGRIDVHFSIEDEILGTGGGIRRVRPQLEGEDEFLLVNGDTVQFPRWDALRAARQTTDALAALTLRHPPEGDRFTPVYFDEGLVTGFGSGTGEPLMFSGSHVISTRIFDYLPDRDFSGIVEHAYIPVLADRREKLAGVVDDGLWFDIGTPQRYLAASRALLDAMVQGALALPEDSRVQGDSLVHTTASGDATRSTVGARSVIEGDVRDSIIWDDCSIARGVTLERCIVGHGVTFAEGAYRDAVIVRDDPAIPGDYERHAGNAFHAFT